MKLELLTSEPEIATRTTPILFVHGAYHGAWCWEENFLPYFSQHGYVSHAMSLRGHGKSEGRDTLKHASIEDYADDVAQVVNGMDKQPILVVHSIGGHITMKISRRIRHPLPS